MLNINPTQLTFWFTCDAQLNKGERVIGYTYAFKFIQLSSTNNAKYLFLV